MKRKELLQTGLDKYASVKSLIFIFYIAIILDLLA